MLLDSIVLKEVYENIFEDLQKHVKARDDHVHVVRYEDQWTDLRERVAESFVNYKDYQLKLRISHS